MKISDVYPRFTITDEWGRTIEVVARNSLYARKPLNTLTPDTFIGEEEGISRVQYAMMLLLKIEELAGEEAIFNQDDPANYPSPGDADLDAHFGSRRKRS